MNRRFGLFTLLMAAFIFTLFSSKALAGWVEVDKFSGTTYISGGKSKHVPKDKGGPWSLFDSETGTSTTVEPANRRYAERTLDELCEAQSRIFEMTLAEFSAEERAKIEQEWNEQIAMLKTPTVTVTKVGSGGKIAGFDTVKYSVMFDGRPYKEVWLATDASIMEDLKVFIKSAFEMNKKIEGCAQAGGGPPLVNPELSKEYIELMEKGWVMKQVYRQGEGMESEVESLTKRDIPASEFKIPADYRRVDMKEMMSRMGR